MFKQKQALVEHIKRIKNDRSFALSLYHLWRINGVSNVALLWAPNNGSSLSVSFGYLLLPIVMVAAGRLILKNEFQH